MKTKGGIRRACRRAHSWGRRIGLRALSLYALAQGSLVASGWLGLPTALKAQEVEAAGRDTPVGREWSGIPALNYDSDEGFGYGAILSLYDYGPGGFSPYRWSAQPMVFFTTEGRKQLSVFFDTPHLIPDGWRLDVTLTLENRVATPYYGLGNDTPFEPELAGGENPYYYRLGQEKVSARVNVHRSLRGAPVRLLLGGSVSSFTIDPTPKDEGTTLLHQELGPDGRAPGGNYVSLRGGVVWDTRDQESQPARGAWSEILLERTDELLGSENTCTRITLADRRYFAMGSRVVLAHRVILQNVAGDPPFFALQKLESSFRPEEGLGGAKSLRGILRNRFTGKGLFIWNAEIRVRLADFSFLSRQGRLTANGFLDSGRVWKNGIRLGEAFSGLHRGVGGGLRVGLGPNFVVGFDTGWSEEAGIQTYIGLGFLY